MSFLLALAAHRWRALLFVGLVAPVAVVAALALWPHAQPAAATGTPSMSLNVKSPAGQCNSPTQPTKCTLPVGTQFILSVIASSPPSTGYTSIQTQVLFGNLTYSPSTFAADEVVWPDESGTQRQILPQQVAHGANTSAQTPRPVSFHAGNLVDIALRCPELGTFAAHLTAYDPENNPLGSMYQLQDDFPTPAKGVAGIAASVEINCALLPTFTPGPSRTPTSTHTPFPTPSGPPSMSLRVGSGTCDNQGNPSKCSIQLGSAFSLFLVAETIPPQGYEGFQSQVFVGSLGYKPGPSADAEVIPPACVHSVRKMPPPPNGEINHACLTGLTVPLPATTYSGDLVQIGLNCSSLQPVEVAVGIYSPTNLLGSEYIVAGSAVPPVAIGQRGTIAIADALTINCVPAPTATASPTPNPVPRMQKLPALQNLFLTRQGAKIPPVRCVDATDVATLTESMDIAVRAPDPKNPSQTQQLGGFSFQVKFNPKLVCIDLNPGPAWSVSPQQICTVDDSISRPTLQGVARISCVTLGKDTVVDTSSPVNRILATITVRAQPEAFTQIIPNQDNGQVAEINNEKCKLTDLQGFPIEVFSCEDAKVILRFLEGDVEPDCQVNTLDTQAIAFRWGALKGSLLYNARFNLEPSGHGLPRDQDIDVNDLQFVFGRFGSTCISPWPAQLPVKAH